MRKPALISFAVICAFVVSCKKDKQGNAALNGSWRLSSWRDKQVFNDKVQTDTLIYFATTYFRMVFLPGDSCTGFVNRDTIGGKYSYSDGNLHTTPASFMGINLDATSCTIVNEKLTVHKSDSWETPAGTYTTSRDLIFMRL